MRKQYKIFVSRNPNHRVGEVIKLNKSEKLLSEGYMAECRRQGPLGLKKMDPVVPVFMATPFRGRHEALDWFMPSQFKLGVYTGIAKKLKGGKGYRIVWGRINEGLVIQLVDELTNKILGRFTDCYPVAAGDPMNDTHIGKMDFNITFADLIKQGVDIVMGPGDVATGGPNA